MQIQKKKKPGYKRIDYYKKLDFSVDFDIYSYNRKKQDEIYKAIKKKLRLIKKLIEQYYNKDGYVYATVVVVFNVDPFGQASIAGTLVQDSNVETIDKDIADVVQGVNFPASSGNITNNVVAVFDISYTICFDRANEPLSQKKIRKNSSQKRSDNVFNR